MVYTLLLLYLLNGLMLFQMEPDNSQLVLFAPLSMRYAFLTAHVLTSFLFLFYNKKMKVGTFSSVYFHLTKCKLFFSSLFILSPRFFAHS